jgi:hypothetical protein
MVGIRARDPLATFGYGEAKFSTRQIADLHRIEAAAVRSDWRFESAFERPLRPFNTRELEPAKRFPVLCAGAEVRRGQNAQAKAPRSDLIKEIWTELLLSLVFYRAITILLKSIDGHLVVFLLKGI